MERSAAAMQALGIWLFACLPVILAEMLVRQAIFRIPWKWFFRACAFLASAGLAAVSAACIRNLSR